MIQLTSSSWFELVWNTNSSITTIEIKPKNAPREIYIPRIAIKDDDSSSPDDDEVASFNARVHKSILRIPSQDLIQRLKVAKSDPAIDKNLHEDRASSVVQTRTVSEAAPSHQIKHKDHISHPSQALIRMQTVGEIVPAHTMKYEDTAFGTSRALVLSQQSAQKELETRRSVKLANRAIAEADMLESLQSRGYIVNGAEPLKKPHEVKFFRRLSNAQDDEKPSHNSPPTKSDSHEKIQTGEANARNGALAVVLRKGQASGPPRTRNLHPLQGTNRTAKRDLYFFSWSSDTTDHAPTARPISNSANDDDGLQFLSYVLTRVHEKITDSNFDLMTGKTRQDTSFPQMAAQSADLFQHQQPHLDLQSVSFDEIYQPIYQPSKTGDADEVSAQVLQVRVFRRWDNNLGMLQVRQKSEGTSISHWRQDEQLHDINEIVDQILKETREIVSLFAPLEFPHDLLKRIWGALAVIRKVRTPREEYITVRGCIRTDVRRPSNSQRRIAATAM
jgi:hypothetical protein